MEKITVTRDNLVIAMNDLINRFKAIRDVVLQLQRKDNIPPADMESILKELEGMRDTIAEWGFFEEEVDEPKSGFYNDGC